MRIVYYFRELNTPMYWWQRIHLIDELTRAGHEIITFNPLDYASIDEANERVFDAINNLKQIDLFISCVDQDNIYADTVNRIKQKGIPTCMIAWDNLELPYKQKDIAPLFDVVWLTSWETQYLFEQWGCKNIVFATYAANPHMFKPNWKTPIRSVGFIGSPYGSRVNKLNDLINANIPVQVYSNALFNKGFNTSVGGVHKFDPIDVIIKSSRYLRFPIGRQVLYSTIKNKFMQKAKLNKESEFLLRNKSVSDNKMMELYSNLSLSLNITELRDTYICKNPIHKVHLRTFEIPMCGGLELASYTDELAGYFKEDKEIVLYRTKEEMIEKARFYLDPKNDTLVMDMKQAARKRAENEHTWMCRFNEVLKVLSLKAE